MVRQKDFHFRQRRYFSESFKKSVVSQITSRKATVKELSVLYDISVQTLYSWVHKYEPPKEKTIKCVYQMPSEAKKTEYYKKRVSDLERLLGQKAAEIAYLEELLSIVEEEFGVDVKKNLARKLLKGSGQEGSRNEK